MSKKTIAIDIDDVLAANAKGFVEFSNERWGTKLKPDDYTEHWAEMWGIEHDEMNERRATILSEKVFIKHRSFDDAKPALTKLGEKHNLVVVSSRSHEVHTDTRDWIENNFPGIFSEIHFAKIWDDPSVHILDKLKLTKTEICQEIGADYLIDDQPKHCFAVAKAGITTLLFGTYEWTNISNLPKNVIRVKNWQEVLEFFDAESRQTVQK